MSILEIRVTTPKNPLKCHNLLTDVKNGKIEFTPEFALEFVQSTNNHKNIADFLAILEEKLQAKPETAPDYQRVLLGIISRENHPEQTINKAKALYAEHGTTGIEISIAQSNFTHKNEDFQYISKLTFCKGVDNIQCERCDLSKTELDLKQIGLLTRAEFINCKMPPIANLNAGKVWALYFDHMDMTSFKPIYPKEIQWLGFHNETKLPSVIDLSEIEKVDQLTFLECDLQNVEEIKLPQSLKQIYLSHSTLPTWLDIEKLKKNYIVFATKCTTASSKERRKMEISPDAIKKKERSAPLSDRILQKLKLMTTKGR